MENQTLTAQRTEVLEVLREHAEPMRAVEIGRILSKRANAVTYLLWKMERAGDVVKVGYGRYIPAPQTELDFSTPNTSVTAETRTGDRNNTHAEIGLLTVENGRSVESIRGRDEGAFRVGDRIEHPKHGAGTVERTAPRCLYYRPDALPERALPIYLHEMAGICRLDGST